MADENGKTEPQTAPRTGDRNLRDLHRDTTSGQRRGDGTPPGSDAPNSGTPDDPHQGVPDTVR